MGRRRLPTAASGKHAEWAFMKRFEVPSFDEPDVNYMTRLRVIQTPWFGIYLHRFDRPDSRPTLHDHPWPFASFVIGGAGYVERVGLNKTRRRVRWANFKRATDLHYIEELLSPVVWTLVVVGRRRRAWGYADGLERGTGVDYSQVVSYCWTRFDEHDHAHEFDAAMAARKAAR